MSYEYTKNPQTEENEIVIEGWQDGISDNPYTGIADMRNVDNITIPGEVSVAMSTQVMNLQAPIANVTFTVDPATDVFTYNGTIPLRVNTAITVSNSGGALPTGLSADTAYYIKTVTPTTFTLSAVSAGGAILDITGAGSGTNSFSTINIGTPKYYASGKIFPGSISFSSIENILYFMLDSNGRCWVYNSNVLGNTGDWVYMHNQTNEGAFATGGTGLVVYKGFLLLFTGVYIDVIQLIDFNVGYSLASLTKYTNWNKNWQTASGGLSNQAIVSVNKDAVYFCNGVNIGSIKTALNEYFNIANTHTVADGVTTTGSTTITTGTSFFQSTDLGAIIKGTGLPANGSIITSITNSKTAIISPAATSNENPTTFTITSGYSYQSNALDIPSNDSSVCITELGSQLLVGGMNNCIYPWDFTSPSFNTPILLSENYVSRMVTVNTTTYIFCGYRGRIYVTNGSNVNLYWEIPEYLAETVNPYYFWTDAVFNRNQLYFGFKVTTNSGTTIDKFGGMWSIDLDKGIGTGKLQNILSYGTYAGYASAFWINRGYSKSTDPSADGYGLFIGWNNGTVGGIDKSISTPYTAGQAYVVSDIIPVGQYLSKKTFSNMEFKLATPLVTGESVALEYRTNLTEGFTPDPLTQGGGVGELSGIATINFQGVQWLQVKATLTSTATNPSYVRLKSITIR